MSISISGTQGTASLKAMDPSKMASKIASKMMSDLDGNKNGSISKDEFISGMTDKGMSTEDATKMFDAIDTQKNGAITKTDIEGALKSGAMKPPAGGRPPPSGRAGGAGGAAASSDSYDPADTNKDGTVSEQEAQVYAIKHPSKSSTEKSDASKLGQNVDKFV